MRCISMRCAPSAASSRGAIDLHPTVITSRISARSTSIRRSSARRRSPSVNTPCTRSAPSTITVIPRPLRDISARPSTSGVCGRTRGTSAPRRMMSSTRVNTRRASAPPGCERAKSTAVKPRASSSATASASPIASAAVVLAVGARLSGQASSGTLTSSTAAAASARFELGAPVIVRRGTPRRFKCGTSSSSSGVSPEFDTASTTSMRVIMPRSPWLASAGCRKNAGVPVLASVAAILRATWPDLPMPVTTTRPWQSRHTAHAATKRSSSRDCSATTACASMPRARRAAASSRRESVARVGGSLMGAMISGKLTP